MKLLDNFAQLGVQESPGVFVMGGNIDGNDILVKSATAANDDIDPEGVFFPVRIQYADSPTVFMIAKANYTLVGGAHKLEVVAGDVISSSNNDGLIDFAEEPVGTDNLRIFGVNSADLINDTRHGLITTTSNQAQITSTSLVAAAAPVNIPNGSSQSSVIVTLNANVLVQKTASGTSTRFSLALAFINENGATTPASTSTGGLVNAVPSVLGANFSISISALLDQSQLSPASRWTVVPQLAVIDGNTQVSLLRGDVIYSRGIQG